MARKLKHAEKDFTNDMLPQNRKEVFKDVFKIHFWKLFGCGQILFLFLIPIFITALISDVYELMLTTQVLEGSLTTEQMMKQWVGFSYLHGAIDIVLYLLLSVGVAGVSRIIRQLAWEENVVVRSDFIKGIKQNAPQFLILGLIAGVLRAACRFFMVNVKIPYFALIMSAVIIVFFLPVAMYMTVAIPVYNHKFRQNFRICISVYFKHPFKTIGMAILCLLIYIPQALLLFNGVVFYVHIIFWLVSSIISGIIYVIWFLFAMSQFDRTINEKHYPELVDRGILGKKKQTDQEELKQEEIESVL